MLVVFSHVIRLQVVLPVQSYRENLSTETSLALINVSLV